MPHRPSRSEGEIDRLIRQTRKAAGEGANVPPEQRLAELARAVRGRTDQRRFDEVGWLQLSRPDRRHPAVGLYLRVDGEALLDLDSGGIPHPLTVEAAARRLGRRRLRRILDRAFHRTPPRTGTLGGDLLRAYREDLRP